MVGIGAKGEVFAWGRVKCTTPIVVKPGLGMLLPGPKGEGRPQCVLAIAWGSNG